ncbi:DUF6292 family protein [Streptomyces lasiicapitis]|uniref:DUF6292 domain-containing protein n=1 Tax=Streptomyces lasiicapitis TaxID=1923961 RepID=A0ABQ2MUG0_9ACTN|nr:DUF6292 family protein [Streptomyces lasiicapitis]GGO58815.1 hypothetical protein GCM10012286_78970 [Streptomyces lasiicapitis]
MRSAAAGVAGVIRAGRTEFVQTRDELAHAAYPVTGMKPSTFAKHKPYTAEDFPAPISSDDARVLLWDSEQTAAHYADEPVPALPDTDDDQDLLDRNEAAALLQVSPRSWDTYKTDPQIKPHLVKIKGVEHCPRHIAAAYQAARQAGPGRAGNPGRPRGSGDMVPRDEIPQRVSALLDVDAAVTSKTVMAELGLSYVTATRSLSRLRGERVADLLATDPTLTPAAAASQLGYPTAVHRTAIAYARTELRARAVRPYVQDVADALASDGLAQHQDVAVVHVADDVLAAAVVLAFNAPVPALVWDERFGWRTATSRRHPIGRESGRPPEGEGTRYLSAEQQPSPQEVLAAVHDGRRGTRRPAQIHSPPV